MTLCPCRDRAPDRVCASQRLAHRNPVSLAVTTNVCKEITAENKRNVTRTIFFFLVFFFDPWMPGGGGPGTCQGNPGTVTRVASVLFGESLLLTYSTGGGGGGGVREERFARREV